MFLLKRVLIPNGCLFGGVCVVVHLAGEAAARVQGQEEGKAQVLEGGHPLQGLAVEGEGGTVRGAEEGVDRGRLYSCT